LANALLIGKFPKRLNHPAQPCRRAELHKLRDEEVPLLLASA